MDEKDFQLIRVLAETGNITRAAERLYMTQSALSKRIRSIEDSFGVELLLRSRKGVRLTPAGELILSRSMAAQRELGRLRQELDSLSGQVCGTLSVGVSVNYSLYRLPDALAAFHTRHPRVRLRVVTGQSQRLYRGLLEGEFDAAVLRGEYPWDGVQQLLSEERLCVVCSRELGERPLGELLYISHSTDAVQSAMMTRWLRENGLTPETDLFSVDNITACLEMVKRGFGWALLPEIALDGFDGCVRPCFFESGEPLLRRTYALCRRETAELPQVGAFLETLKSCR